MQIQKDEIRERILFFAEKEFQEKGFAKASLRSIALNCQIAVSNLYHYFTQKDAIFCEVLSPVTRMIDDKFALMDSYPMYKSTMHWSFAWHEKMIHALAEFIEEHRAKLKLLVFNAHGSSLQGYRDQLIERYTRLSEEYIANAQRYYPDMKCCLSRFCLHNLTSFQFNIISEILMHDIPYDEMLSSMREILVFMFYGYEGVFAYDFEKMEPKPLHSPIT